jgi:hypothetical protein
MLNSSGVIRNPVAHERSPRNKGPLRLQIPEDAGAYAAFNVRAFPFGSKGGLGSPRNAVLLPVGNPAMKSSILKDFQPVPVVVPRPYPTAPVVGPAGPRLDQKSTEGRPKVIFSDDDSSSDDLFAGF